MLVERLLIRGLHHHLQYHPDFARPRPQPLIDSLYSYLLILLITYQSYELNPLSFSSMSFDLTLMSLNLRCCLSPHHPASYPWSRLGQELRL